MKKYSSPTIEQINIECEQMIAQSVMIDKESSGSEQLSNKHRGEWGNVWGK